MKPTEDWIKDWRYGVDPNLEKSVSEGLIEIFKDFWLWANLDTKSKSTQQRYSAALHALGGYLIEQIGNSTIYSGTTQDFLAGYIDAGEGPLIYQDNEGWQNELDTVCRKLYKYLGSQC
ncbi:hypothetical protein [Microbulbifer rhizosphaerae]|uniref:Core-binding (CB) domain-containing protein n=1 Tax=Microbulbifer rhizosphaerae TaxID=1562603 RepID=A0A7W4WEQ4_9GAMM|nr:hypothetical protein [Microbulbifer rhizosphaerae]MBB3062836.1 hypothetical protein [Microbulbifer rhizosphaerae]